MCIRDRCRREGRGPPVLALRVARLPAPARQAVPVQDVRRGRAAGAVVSGDALALPVSIRIVNSRVRALVDAHGEVLCTVIGQKTVEARLKAELLRDALNATP